MIDRILHDTLLSEPRLLLRDETVNDPAMPSVVLSRLTRSDDATVRFNLATYLNKPYLLNVLAGDEDPEVRQRVAQNHSTSATDVLKLVADEDPHIRVAAAANERVQADYRADNAGYRGDDPDPEVRAAYLTNPSANVRVLAEAARSDDPAIRALAAANPSTGAQTLRVLSADTAVEVREKVAENPSTSRNDVFGLAHDKAWPVALSAVSHIHNQDDLKTIIENQPHVIASEAYRRIRDHAILTRAAGDPNWEVRYNVAQNEHAHPDVLVRLIDDTDISVRVTLAERGDLPPVVLRAMAESPNATVRFEAARRAETPPDCLVVLATDPGHTVRRAVASNPSLPEAACEALAADGTRGIADRLLRNTATTRDVRARLSEAASHRGATATAGASPLSGTGGETVDAASLRSVAGWVAAYPNAWDRAEAVRQPTVDDAAVLALLGDDRPEVRIQACLEALSRDLTATAEPPLTL